jgi:hypothetical protein
MGEAIIFAVAVMASLCAGFFLGVMCMGVRVFSEGQGGVDDERD